MPSLIRLRIRQGAAIALLAALLLGLPGLSTAGSAVLPRAPAGGPSASPVPAAGAPAWFNVTSNQRFSPPPLVGSSIVYDPADNELVLFGGCSPNACPAPPQTWVYLAGAWTNITSTSPQPPGRAYAGFTYDSRDGYAVLFGGRGTSGLLNDTWSFSAGVWTNLTNTSLPAPSPRWAMQLAFDRADAYVVLFGGCGSVCPLNDTWHFAAGTWRNVTLSLVPTPLARYAAAFAFDSGDNYLLLVGGCGSVCPLNDTWQFSHGHWTQIPLNVSLGPPPRAFASLTFDTVQNATFLYGGNGSTGPRSDTWRWANAKWVNVTPLLGSGPGPRLGTAALSSTIANTLSVTRKWPFDLFYGGTAGPTPFSTPDGDTWVAEAPPVAAASVIPSVVETGQVATFTGSASGGSPPYVFLWQFGDGVSSSVAGPTHVFSQTGMFQPNLTLTDSAGVVTRASTTLTVVAGPTPTIMPSPGVTDTGVPVSFSAGVEFGTPPYQYHWSFGDGGTSTQTGPSHAYVLPGTYLVNLTVTDTILGLGVRYTNVTVHEDPSLTTSYSSDTPAVGVTVNFTAAASLGTGPYTYRWVFGDGTTSGNASATHAYAQPGIFNASVTVTDSVGADVVQNFSIHVGGAPDSSTGPSRWFGLTDVQWGLTILGIAALVAAGGTLVLVLRHRRRRPGTPIAAAAAGQPDWEDDSASGPSSTSRSYRRSYRR